MKLWNIFFKKRNCHFIYINVFSVIHISLEKNSSRILQWNLEVGIDYRSHTRFIKFRYLIMLPKIKNKQSDDLKSIWNGGVINTTQIIVFLDHVMLVVFLSKSKQNISTIIFLLFTTCFTRSTNVRLFF